MKENPSQRAKRLNLSTPPHPSLLDRLLLAWVRSHLHFHRLSYNVLSEITTFLGYFSNILCQDKGRLYGFTPARGKWKSYSVCIPGLDAFRVMGAVEIGDQQWFLTTDLLPQEYAYIVGSNKAQVVRADWRVACGLLYLFSQNTVYIFGGLHKSISSESANAFSVTFGANNRLGRMHKSRSAFTPCWHRNIAYLIGGGSCLVETFEPVLNVFALLSEPLLPTERGCLSVSVAEDIYIIGKRLVRWSPDTGRVRVTRGHLRKPRTWHCSGVAFGGCYFLTHTSKARYCGT
jgi:hypothetical protein